MKVKSIFLAVAGMIVFASCAQQVSQPPLPEITIDKSSLAFDYGIGQEEIVISTNRAWSVESSADWLAFDPSEGGADGDMASYTVTVTALKNNVGNSRQAKVRFNTRAVYASLDITQALNPEEVPVDIYRTDFGEKLDGDNPALASSTCWYGPSYESGYALETRQFYVSSTRVTVRNSSTTSSSGYPGASGNNHIHFGSDMPSFVIGDLKMHPDIRTLTVSFGLLRNQYDETGTIDNSVNPAEFPVFISKDGQTWLPLEYSAAPIGDDKWSYCTATFSFAEAIDKLYIKFTTTVASTYRLDDVAVTASEEVGEETVDWASGTAGDLGTLVTLK